jgi:surface protein
MFLTSSTSSFNQDIGNWDIRNVSDFVDFMAGKSPANYSSANLDLIYNKWSLLPVQAGITISFGSIQWVHSYDGRGILTSSPNNWSITDGGQIPFEFTVDTAIAGVSGIGNFRLPLTTSTGLLAIVDWGDDSVNTITSHTAPEVTHTYASSGVYTVKITGKLLGWRFNSSGDRLKMLNVSQWAGLNISVDSGFSSCTNLTATATDAPLITSTSLSGYFGSCNNFNGEIGNWDVSNVTNLGSMFSAARAFNKNIGSWNTANVTNMGSMFNLANSFNNGGSNSISSWNTSKVTNMTNMFKECFFGTPNISSWDTSKVTNMSGMFDYCQNNSNFGSWDVSNVTNMSLMFRNNFAFNQNIGAWNVSKVTNFGNMFFNATAFNNGGSDDIDNWTFSTTSNINMGGMFGGDNTTISCKFNRYIGSWNTERVTNMSSMFFANTAFNQNIGAWNVSKVTSFTNMFYISGFNNGGSDDIDNWTFSTTSNINMAGMLRQCPFNQPIGSWNVSKVTDMSAMFRSTPFNQDIGSWDVSSVTSMSSMFNNAAFNQNIGAWNVSNVTNFGGFMGSKTAANYSATNLASIYNGWSQLTLQPNLTIDFNTIDYCDTSEANKQSIVTNFGWNITDGNAVPC